MDVKRVGKSNYVTRKWRMLRYFSCSEDSTQPATSTKSITCPHSGQVCRVLPRVSAPKAWIAPETHGCLATNPAIQTVDLSLPESQSLPLQARNFCLILKTIRRRH